MVSLLLRRRLLLVLVRFAKVKKRGRRRIIVFIVVIIVVGAMFAAALVETVLPGLECIEVGQLDIHIMHALSVYLEHILVELGSMYSRLAVRHDRAALGAIRKV